MSEHPNLFDQSGLQADFLGKTTSFIHIFELLLRTCFLHLGWELVRGETAVAV